MSDSRQQFLRFAGVGGAGFLVDGGLLWVLLSAGVDPFLGRAVSFPVAVLVTWLLNRIWTFSSASRLGLGRQLYRYLAVQIAGALVNYAIYALVLIFIVQTPTNALFALMIGAIFGLVINFTGAKMIVFQFDKHLNASRRGMTK